MKKPHITDWISQFLSRENQIAIKYKKDNQWINMTWTDYLKNIVCLNIILQKTLAKKNTQKCHIALMSNTRWEWSAFDLAIIGNNDITVPLYSNQTDADLIYILENCRPKLIIFETIKMHEQFKKIEKDLTFKLKTLVIEVLEINIELIKNKDCQIFINQMKKIKNEDTLSIIYTSGTTGNPKGVVLQHQALVSEIVEGFALFDLFTVDNQPKVSLSFLPFAHVMGRIEHFGSVYAGYTLAFAENIDSLKKNLKEIRPDFLVAVPRIFEKIYSQVLNQIETQKYKKKLFEYTMDLARKVSYHRSTRQTMNLSLILQYEFLSRLVFAPIQKAFGGRLKFAICGGAAMSEELVTLFSLMGIEILVGYGLTETFAAVTINTIKNKQIGTVGKPIGDVEIKFEPDGEILIRSQKCMHEYYNNPQATAEVIDAEGFFRTGDIGELTDDGYLKITDRKKDLIKTSGGKYVAPQKLENMIKQNPFISEVLIVGEQQKFVSALLNIGEQNLTAEISKKIKHAIQDVNSKLATYETIKKFEIVNDIWTTANGSLTPSLKVKRKFLEKKYKTLIQKIYD